MLASIQTGLVGGYLHIYPVMIQIDYGYDYVYSLSQNILYFNQSISAIST